MLGPNTILISNSAINVGIVVECLSPYKTISSRGIGIVSILYTAASPDPFSEVIN